MEYLRKIQEAARQTSPSGISSSTGQAERANSGGGGGRNGHAAARSEPPVPGSESHLFSRLYLENMVKSAAAAAAGQSFYYLVLSMCYRERACKCWQRKRGRKRN